MTVQRGSRFVLITGASTGIGAACAIGCAQQGMTVFAGVRDMRAGEALHAKGRGNCPALPRCDRHEINTKGSRGRRTARG